MTTKDIDTKAIACFLDAVYPLYNDLKHYIYTLCADYYLTEDVVNDILLMAWTKLYDMQAKRDLRRYLMRCAKNRMLNCLRANGRVVYIDDPTVLYDDPNPDILLRLIREQDYATAAKTLCGLSLIEQRIIKMFYIYGETLVDIADYVHLPYSTVSTIKRRALDKLAAQLERIILLLFLRIKKQRPFRPLLNCLQRRVLCHQVK